MGIEKDETKEVEEKFEIEETEQQIIMQEALAKMLKRGSRGSGFVIFRERGTDFIVMYSFDEKGFMLFFQKGIFNNEHFNNTIKLIQSLKFKLWNFVSGSFPIFDIKEFVVSDNEIYAQCGEDVDFIAYLSDRIFRDVFKTEDDYKIKIKVE